MIGYEYVVSMPEKESEYEPAVSWLRDWLRPESVIFWIFWKERDCNQATILGPAEVTIVDEIERLLCAVSSK